MLVLKNQTRANNRTKLSSKSEIILLEVFKAFCRLFYQKKLGEKISCKSRVCHEQQEKSSLRVPS